MLSGGKTPADLALSEDGTSCVVEALAILRDEPTRQASAWLDDATLDLHTIGRRYGVDFCGTVDEPLDKHETSIFFQEIERRAAAVQHGLELPELRLGDVAVDVVPAVGSGGRTAFRTPTVSHGRRIADKLATKAEQTRRSHADWLLVDSVDNLWHISEWAHKRLADKARDLAALARATVASERHLAGVVLTDGATLMRPEAEDEAIDIGGLVIALRRRVDSWRVRESVIVGLHPAALAGAQLWRRVLDSERGWLARSVSEVGLRAPPELVADAVGR